MVLFATKYCDSELVLPVGDSKLDFASKQQVCAVHEVCHHVLKHWLECFRVNDIEENLLGSCNLKPLISFYIIDRALFLN